MRVLDIITFTLLDHVVPIEDPNTLSGRLWQYGDLQELLDARGILHVCWSRTDEDAATVYLFALWENESFRADFHRSKRPTGMIDCYLRYPCDLRYMQCPADFRLEALTEHTLSAALLTLCTSPKPGEDVARLTEKFERTWPNGRIICSKINDERCVHEGFTECSCNRGTRIMMIAASLPHTTASGSSEAPKIASAESLASTLQGFSHLHIHHATLKPAKRQPLPETAPTSPTRLSDLFKCNKSQFGQKLASPSPFLPEPIAGPRTDWAPPSVPNHHFRNRLARPAPSTIPRGADGPPSQPRRHRATTRFTFRESLPRSAAASSSSSSSSSSALDAAWLAHLAAVSAALPTGAEKVFILAYPDTRPLVLDLLIECPNAPPAAPPTIPAALRPHLSADPVALPNGAEAERLPLPPGGGGGDRLLEVLELRFPCAGFSALDARAVELLFADFAAAMGVGTMCVGEAREGVSLVREGEGGSGWVGGEGGDEVRYRRLVWWDGEDVEAWWVRRFVEQTFDVLGRRAWAVRVAGARVGGERVAFEEVDVWRWREGGDEDMGF